MLLQGMKPTWRGIPDVIATVLAVPASAILIGMTRDGIRFPAVIYGIGLTLLFAVSATYHTPMWPLAVRRLLRRIDHSTIYILIAATYTPPTLLIIPEPIGARLFGVIWLAALGGVLKSFLWPEAPRWLNTAIYIALGWVVLPFAPVVIPGYGLLNSGLLLGGGIMYTLGAVIYARRWPNPSPTRFGYHEVFHLFVIAAAACHYLAQWRLLT